MGLTPLMEQVSNSAANHGPYEVSPWQAERARREDGSPKGQDVGEPRRQAWFTTAVPQGTQ